jgi:hypothetical protein
MSGSSRSLQGVNLDGFNLDGQAARWASPLYPLPADGMVHRRELAVCARSGRWGGLTFWLKCQRVAFHPSHGGEPCEQELR